MRKLNKFAVWGYLYAVTFMDELPEGQNFFKVMVPADWDEESVAECIEFSARSLGKVPSPQTIDNHLGKRHEAYAQGIWIQAATPLSLMRLYEITEDELYENHH